MSSMQHLTIRQLKFIDLYIESGNAYQSYIKAGYNQYSTRNAVDVSVGKLVRKPHIQAAINHRRLEIESSQRIRLESKRSLLWEIANECRQADPKAAVAALNELNRMDGHHIDAKVRAPSTPFVFDAEILPPEAIDSDEKDEQRHNDVITTPRLLQMETIRPV